MSPGHRGALALADAIVERWLWQTRGLRRQDLGRAEFLREVWRWKERHGDEILQQLRALGASLDWSRCAFTMDPGFSRAVTEAFVRLAAAGLIRRDERVVTWSCALRSALADVEVEPRVLTGPTALSVPNCPHPVTFGLLVTFAYPVEGDDGLEVPVATTRPETLFGDVAVAVHPRDPRYLGVPRFEARARVVAALAQRGLLRGVQDHAMTLPLCSRSGDVVEFLLKRQWFLSCGDMARAALQAVTSGRLRLVPKFHEKNWKTWMENAGDWCLSRQLWWGHQVPAYQVMGGHQGAPGGHGGAPGGHRGVVPVAPLDRWLLARLAAAGAECCGRLGALEVQGALGAVQSFWLRCLCDVYLVGPPKWHPETGTQKWAPRNGTPKRAPRNGHHKMSITKWAPRNGHPERAPRNGHPEMGTMKWAPRNGHPKMGITKWAPQNGHPEMGTLNGHPETGTTKQEVAKASLRSPQLRPGAVASLAAAAELGLRLLAPFAPFLAEELWQRLPRAPPAPPSVSLAPFPEPQRLAHWRSPELEAQVAAMLELVRAVRGLRESLRLGGAARPPDGGPRGGSHIVGVVFPAVLVQCPEPDRDWLEPLGPALQALSGAGPGGGV
uniref:valine--tRNA ligase, mitochondrial n=1 Tax=Lonchura striata TaxID=40157 RepID=UPI000B4C7C7D|nr:valine--tRNA ligase, mitochondrial-like [Lonchura striata domestica]